MYVAIQINDDAKKRTPSRNLFMLQHILHLFIKVLKLMEERSHSGAGRAKNLGFGLVLCSPLPVTTEAGDGCFVILATAGG